jgi:hypothetical protein
MYIVKLCLSLNKEQRLRRMFGNRVLRRIFGHKREEVRKWHEVGEDCTMRSFITHTFHEIL